LFQAPVPARRCWLPRALPRRPCRPDHVGVELVSEATALVPGRSATLGLRFVHEPHWHTYWINPGDSGLATKLSWKLPADFRAGEILWPVPQRFDVGGLFNFGYSGDALLPVRLDVPVKCKTGYCRAAGGSKHAGSCAARSAYPARRCSRSTCRCRRVRRAIPRGKQRSLRRAPRNRRPPVDRRGA
jgi:hypothetical protein